MKNQILLIGGGMTFDSQDDYLNFLKTVELDFARYVDDKKSWKNTFRQDLGDEYEVVMAEMPGKMNAHYSEWNIWFEKIIPHLRENVLLMGHSLGGIFLAKYLSENDFRLKISGLFLLAAPFDDASQESLGDFKLGSDFTKLNDLTDTIVLFQSDDDVVVPPAEAEKYLKVLPKARIRKLLGYGHLFPLQFPELIEEIKIVAG